MGIREEPPDTIDEIQEMEVQVSNPLMIILI